MTTWTDSVSAIASVIGAIAGIIAALIAVFQLRTAAHQVRESARQTQRESLNRQRPYVHASIVPGIAGPESWDLRIVNSGGSTASDIRVHLGAEEEITGRGKDEIFKRRLERFMSKGFELAPSASIRVLWTVTADAKNVEIGAPVIGNLTISYSWRDQTSTVRKFESALTYDISLTSGLMAQAYQGRKSSGQDSKEKNIEHALRAIAQNIGELRR